MRLNYIAKLSRKLTVNSLFLALFLNLNAYAITSFDLHNISKVRNLGITGQGVTVAMLDGGFNTNHYALEGKFEQLYNNNTSTSYYSHGTFVAGIIGANRTDNEYFGIATGAKLVGVGNIRHTDASNSYIADHSNVKIINNSHNGNYQQNKNYARAGKLVIFANDNDGRLNPSNAAMQPSYDESLRAWITVGNIDQSTITRNSSGQLVLGGGAIYNNGGSLCGAASLYCVMAAGQNVRSLDYRNLLRHGTGTSFSAPVVSGVAALVFEKFPFMNGKQVADVILSTANRDFITPKVVMKGTQVIYIDTAVPSDQTQIRQDLAAVYGWGTANKANVAGAVSKSKEEVYGQGIVDAYKAINGLSMIDINRLSDSDKKTLYNETAAFYELNLGSYDAEFNNDIEQRVWDNKYHTSATSNKPTTLAGLNAGFIKNGIGTLSISGDLQYLGATIVRQGALNLVQKANRAALNVAGNIYVENAATLNTQGVINLAQSLYLNAGSALNSQGVITIAQNLVNNDATVTLLNGALIAIGGTYKQEGANSKLVVHFTPNSNLFAQDGKAALQSASQNTANLQNSTNLASEMLDENLGENSSVNSALQNENSSSENLALQESTNSTQNANSVSNSTSINSNNAQTTFSVNTLDIKGGKLVYVPTLDKLYSSNSVINIILSEDLNSQVSNFSQIEVANDSKIYSYTLLEDGKSVQITTKQDAFLVDGVSVSLASEITGILDQATKDTNSPYSTYLTALNNNTAAHDDAIKSIDNRSYLSQTEQILETQSANIMANFINLSEVKGSSFKITPNYTQINLKGEYTGKSNNLGGVIMASKKSENTAFTGFVSASLLKSDFDNNSEINSKLIIAGLGASKDYSMFKLFGGVSLGAGFNSLEREIYNTSNAKGDYQNYFASASVGLGKDFSASVFNLTPMIYATYTYARSSKFSEDGVLFTKEYSPLNHNVISGAAGLNASVGLGENFELGAHAFWEQKVLGSELKNEAKFKDYGGKFEQNYDLAKNVARLGVKAAYKNENLSLSLGLNSALNSDYSSIGGVASFEYKFASKNSTKANLVRNKRLVKSSLKSKSVIAKSSTKSTAQSSKMPKKVAKNQI